jgi:hypothetical protein
MKFRGLSGTWIIVLLLLIVLIVIVILSNQDIMQSIIDLFNSILGT